MISPVIDEQSAWIIPPLIPTLFYLLSALTNWKAKGALWGHKTTTSLLGLSNSLSSVACLWGSELPRRLRHNTHANLSVLASALKVLNYLESVVGRVFPVCCEPALRLFSVDLHSCHSPGAVLNQGQNFSAGQKCALLLPLTHRRVPCSPHTRGRPCWRTEVSAHR